MCSMEKRDIISCQIAYFPIDSQNYSDDIKEVLNLIKISGLEYNIGDMSTIIKGEPERVMDLINNIHSRMSSEGRNYTMSIMISNICGC